MSDLRARREARMRRILENSASRLNKITNGAACDEGGGVAEEPTVDTAGLSSSGNTTGTTTKARRISNQSNVREIFNNTTDEASHSTVDEEFLPLNGAISNLREKLLITFALLTGLAFSILEHTKTFQYLKDNNLNNIFLPYVLFAVFDYKFFRPLLMWFRYEAFIRVYDFGAGQECVDNLLNVAKLLIYVVHGLAIYLFVFTCTVQISQSLIIFNENARA